MSMLNKLTSIVEKPAKRIGRGYGSGKGGHTVGRGTKGQRARKSGEAPAWFEGGQLPLIKRLPMQRGKMRFKSLTPTAMVTLSDLNRMSAEVTTLDALKLEKIIDLRFARAKVVANGELTRKVQVRGVGVSATAAAKITKLGGEVETV